MAEIEERMARRARAEALLRDDLLMESFETVHREYEREWRNTKDDQKDQRERLWWAVKTVGLVKSHLIKVAQDGKLAQQELEHITKFGDRKKFLGVI